MKTSSKLKASLLCTIALLSFSSFAGLKCGDRNWVTKCSISADMGSIKKCDSYGYYRTTATFGECGVSREECLRLVHKYLLETREVETPKCGSVYKRSKSVEYEFVDRSTNEVIEGELENSKYSD